MVGSLEPDALGLQRLVGLQAAQAAAARLSLLDEASTLLSATPDYETTLQWVARLVVPRLGDWCMLDIVGEDGSVRRLEVAHADPKRQELAERLRQFPAGTNNPGSPASKVLVSGRSQLYAETTDAILASASSTPEHLDVLRALAPCSAIVVPLRARGRTLGALSLFAAESQRHFDQADLSLVEELARRCALSVDNARILAAERRERVASQSLQAITAALSRALTLAEVAELVISHGLPGIGADAGAVALLDEHRGTLQMVRALGYPPAMVTALERTPILGTTPMALAVRQAAPVWREASASDPDQFADYARVNRDFPSGVALPLMVNGRVIGALALSFVRKRTFDERDRAYAAALAAQCSLAIERAQLYEAEQRARSAAEASAAQLDVILRGVVDGILAHDSTGQLIYANQAAARSLGFESVADLLATGPDERLARFEILDESGQPLPPSQLPTTRAFAGESVPSARLRLRVRRTGEERWVLISSTPVRDETGRVNLAISIFRDITEQHAEHVRTEFLAEASTVLGSSLDYELTLSRLAELAVPRLADACIIDVLTPEGTVRRLPMVFAEGSPEDLAPALASLGPPDLHGPGAAAEVLRTGKPVVFPTLTDDLIRATARGEEHARWLRAAGMRSSMLLPLVARGSVLGAVTLVVTARSGRSYAPADVRLAQEVTQRAAQAMDNARLYEATRAAEQAAREALRARDEFLSIASHELRTPVTAIKSLAQLLQRARERGLLDPARLDRSLSLMMSSSDRLAALTEDLLDVSRLQSGRFELHPALTDLGAAVSECVESMRAQLEGRHRLTLHIVQRCEAQVDRVRLEQVIANLVSNALKCSPQGGEIGIEVRRSDGGVQISVCDQGIGLAADQTEVIFEPFGRAPNASERHIQGMGLGLYICRQIIERHGGRIWADSAGVDRGSTFSVWLPCAEANERA